MKGAIFGFNGARHYHLDLQAAANELPRDGISQRKAAYLENGGTQQRRLRLRGQARLIQASLHLSLLQAKSRVPGLRRG